MLGALPRFTAVARVEAVLQIEWTGPVNCNLLTPSRVHGRM